MRALIVLGIVAVLAGEAAADDSYTADLKRMEERLKTTPPARGVEHAPVAPPGWCGPLTEKPYGGGFDGRMDDFYSSPAQLYKLVGAAGALCKNDPKEPIIQRAAQEVLQNWMNVYGLSAKDAAESLKLTLDKDANEAAQKKLCDALTLSDEIGGAERAFTLARRELFDCGGDRISTVAGAPMVQLVPWLDSSAKEPDELVRLAFVSKEANAIATANADYLDKALAAYAVAQYDFKALRPDAALALLETEPYKGNIFARVAVKETLGQTRLNLLAVEEALSKRTDKDPDWKELLVTAPQRGIASWTEAAAKWKAEIQRSAEFEQTAFGPSRKATAGCLPVLKKDVVAVLKTLKHDTPSVLIEQMNANPVAGLLFRRFGACLAADGDSMAAREMTTIKGIRVTRGPRAAAYYAALDTLGKIRADRPKFPIEENQLPIDREEILFKLTDDMASGKGDATGYSVWVEKGVVKTVKKDKDGVKVAFATDKQQIWNESCQSTNRIIMFERDGTPIYDRKCKGSVVTADVSPNPITVPADLAEGVAAGRLMAFGVSNSQERRVSLPFEIYSDGKGKNLVAWYTLVF